MVVVEDVVVGEISPGEVEMIVETGKLDTAGTACARGTGRTTAALRRKQMKKERKEEGAARVGTIKSPPGVLPTSLWPATRILGHMQ
jgi:hypothetical protein